MIEIVNITGPKIVKIIFNWYQYSDGNESGEACDIAEVGDMVLFGYKINPETKKREQDRRKVKSIIESRAKTYYIIHFEDLSYIRIYNPNMVYYENTLKE